MNVPRRAIVFAIVSPLFLWTLLEIGSVLLLTVVVEPLAMVSVSEPDTLMPFSHNLLWTLTANDEFRRDGISYTTDEHGLRVLPPSGRGKSILVVGDSSTYGYGVAAEQTYVAQLGECMGLPVINGGVPGYSSEQSRLQLQALLPERNVSWVVIANLWSDMMLAPQTDAQRLMTVQRMHEHNQVVGSWLFEKSAVYRLIQSVARGQNTATPIPIDAILKASEQGKTRRVPVEEYTANIQSMAELAQSAGANVVVLQLPTNRSGPHPSDDEQSGYRQGGMKSGVPVVNMDLVYGDLSASTVASRFVDFVHPSALGHQEIARELCATMRSNP